MRLLQLLIIGLLRELSFEAQALPLLRIETEDQFIGLVLHQDFALFHGLEHVLAFLDAPHLVLHFLVLELDFEVLLLQGEQLVVLLLEGGV